MWNVQIVIVLWELVWCWGWGANVSDVSRSSYKDTQPYSRGLPKAQIESIFGGCAFTTTLNSSKQECHSHLISFAEYRSLLCGSFSKETHIYKWAIDRNHPIRHSSVWKPKCEMRMGRRSYKVCDLAQTFESSVAYGVATISRLWPDGSRRQRQQASTDAGGCRDCLWGIVGASCGLLQCSHPDHDQGLRPVDVWVWKIWRARPQPRQQQAGADVHQCAQLWMCINAHNFGKANIVSTATGQSHSAVMTEDSEDNFYTWGLSKASSA